jgi:magnesium transporter
MPTTARLYRQSSDRAEEVPLGSLSAPRDDRAILWVDLADEDPQMAEIGQRLGLDEAAQGLAAAEGGAIVLRADDLRLSVSGLHDGAGALERVPLHMLLARNLVLTVHARSVRGLADPIEVVSEDPRFGRLDAGRFAGLLLDGVLEGYDAAVEDLEEEIDRLDERALRDQGNEELLEEMVALRRRISLLRRWLAPSRPVVAALTRPIDEEPSPIGMPDADLLAHVDRTLDAIERCREQLLGSFDIVMTRTNQRTNDVVRVLTVVSAVLLPSVVIAGVMGMNFRIGLFDDSTYFYVVVGAMLALAIATLLFARWRGWI